MIIVPNVHKMDSGADISIIILDQLNGHNAEQLPAFQHHSNRLIDGDSHVPLSAVSPLTHPYDELEDTPRNREPICLWLLNQRHWPCILDLPASDLSIDGHTP